MKDDNFGPISQVMIAAMRDKDADFRIAQSACEFWSGVLSYVAENEEAKINAVRSLLPQLLPLMMEGCLMTDNDRMDMIETKDEDLYEERKPQGLTKEGEEDGDGEEENYEVDLAGIGSGTLR